MGKKAKFIINAHVPSENSNMDFLVNADMPDEAMHKVLDFVTANYGSQRVKFNIIEFLYDFHVIP